MLQPRPQSGEPKFPTRNREIDEILNVFNELERERAKEINILPLIYHMDEESQQDFYFTFTVIVYFVICESSINDYIYNNLFGSKFTEFVYTFQFPSVY